MRTYTISPYIKTYKNGKQAHQGFQVVCNKGTFTVTHSEVELCETAIMHREQVQHFGFKPCVYGKDWQVKYDRCFPEEHGGISPERLAVYGLEMEKNNAPKNAP